MNPMNQNSSQSDGKAFPGPNNPRSPQYKFTEDELRVIKECNDESFYQRCLPLSGILGAGSYYAVKSGYIAGNPRFGAVPKVALGVIIGYFVGKFSYQSKCAEKLMALPNSQIGEMLRKRRRGQLHESADAFGAGMSLAPFPGITSTDTYSDVAPPNNLDIDTSRPYQEGLDDAFRPSVDNPIYEEEMPPIQQNVTTSYDELRKKNREEYQQRRSGTYTEPAKPAPHNPSTRPTDNEMRKPKNKYGDEFE